jgi:poly(A) polymerase
MSPSEDLLTRAAEFLSARGITAYVVGGAVRDRFLSRPERPGAGPADIDLLLTSPVVDLVDELADETAARAVVIDHERGFVRLIDPSDERKWLDLAVFDGDLVSDLERRDFTINAMAVPLDKWLARDDNSDIKDAVVDPHGGMADLRQRVIRETSPGNLLDDPVRMLRAVRFATQLEFEIEADTAAIIRDNGDLLGNASPERVRDEFFAMMASHRPEFGIRELDRLGLLDLLLPELTLGRDFEQPREHYYSVMEHQLHALGFATRLVDPAIRSTDPLLKDLPWGPQFDDYLLEIVGNGQTRGTLLKIVAMLHDIGKPETKTVDPPTPDRPNGRIRFLTHDELGSRMVSDLLTRFRCSRHTIAHVSLMIEKHMRPGQMSSGSSANHALLSNRAIYRYFRDVSPVAVDTVLLNLCDYLSARGPRLTDAEFQRFLGLLSDILSRGLKPEPERYTEDLLVDGYQVQERYGLQPGPEIGRLLGALRDAESSGVVRTKAEAYELLARLLGRAASRRGRP